MYKYRKQIGKNKSSPDYATAIIAVALSVFGRFMVASATNGSDNTYVIKQSFAVFLGICAMIILSYVNYEIFLNTRLCVALFCLEVFLLVLTLLIGVGSGNRNWIEFTGLSLNIQPSEIVKILFIVTFAKHLDYVKDDLNKYYSVLLLLLHAGIVIGLVLLQGDLGSALVFCFIMLAMCYTQGISLWYLLGSAVAAILAAPYLWGFLKPYQQQRILVGFNPESDPLNYGYQQILSKQAVANGGIFGTGYMNAAVSPTIPYNHTDMIFAVVAEEFGIVGVFFIFALLIMLVLRIIKGAFIARKDFGSAICAGIAAMIIAQTVENIGMSLGVLPIVGITLPFISYGGSSVISMFMGIGLVMSIYRYRSKYFFERESS